MKKAIVCIISTAGGLMVISAALCVILSIIYFITYKNALWLLLAAAPVALWVPIKAAYGICDKINNTEEMNE